PAWPYDHGTVVRLTPVPDAGYHFTGWSGDASGSDDPLDVTMNAIKTITAAFAANSYALDVTVPGGHGSVTRQPPVGPYDHGTVVRLTPVADAGYHFVG